MRLLLLLIVATTLNSFAADIKNAKIGSTIISNWSVVGHAAVIVKEYTNDDDKHFIIGSHSGGVRYDSFNDHLEGGDIHLGHYRATERNYTFNVRKFIKIAAERAVEADTEYIFTALYTYLWDPIHFDNIPYNLTTIPTAFRCDGLAEWTTEIGMNPNNANSTDGFYLINNPTVFPRMITLSQPDTIGKPYVPILSLSDAEVNATFSPISGAYSEAIYVLFRSEADNPSVMSEIYCGTERSFIDTITDDMEGRYYYALRIGERTDTCGYKPDLSQRSEMSFVDINKTCKSPNLFEIVSQTDVNTSDWRVSVKNLETNETQEGVYPFNLDGNGSLYQLENEEWVLASCGGTEYSTEWLEQKEKEFYMLNNPQGEIIKKDDQNDSKEVLTRLNYTCAVDGRREDYFFDTTAWVRYQRSIWCFQENSRDDYSIFGDVDATIRDVVPDTTTRLIDARRGHDMVKLLYGDRIDYYFESKLNEVKDVYGDDKVDVTYFNSHDRSTPVDTIEPDCAIYEYPNPDYDYVPLVVTDCISYKLMKVTIYK